MKKIKIGTIIIFALLLFIPLYKFNFQENAVSEIDNRMLTENPFVLTRRKTRMIQRKKILQKMRKKKLQKYSKIMFRIELVLERI